MKPSLDRHYEVQRNEDGQVVRLNWLGDTEPEYEKSQADKDAERLAEYERIYGRRPE